MNTSSAVVPISPGQIRALHAIARRRGMTREQLHEAAGVETLKSLSVTQASRLIDRLQIDSRRGSYEPPEPNRAKVRGSIRNATRRQRNAIHTLAEQLGWNAEKLAGWLLERHEIRDLAGGVFTTRVASEAIYQLEQAVMKQRPSGRSAPPADRFEGSS